MSPRYLANPFEEEVLHAIDGFSPAVVSELERPLPIIDVRNKADDFRARLRPTLVAALTDKIRNKNITYVSGLGEHGRRYAMQALRERHAQLGEATRTKAKTALSQWRSHRAKIASFESELDFASGIAIRMPVLGVLLHYDLALAAEFG